MSATPRLVISAPSSGHGKTAVSVGLLAAFTGRGLRVGGFKVGPDHVDAAYLALAAGRPARNLDPRMVGAERIGPLFGHGGEGLDLGVVEGSLGLYDALGGRTDGASTARIAGLLRAPVVLVVDAGAMGQSVAALVHGFRAYDELLWLGGVILNRVASGRHEQLLREALDDVGVPVYGVLRRDMPAGGGLPPRALGVTPAVHRGLDAVRAVRRLGEIVAAGVDLERLLVLARSAPRLSVDPWSAREAVTGGAPTGDVFAPVEPPGFRPVIAVAAGYGYVETAELLSAAGAEVVPVDPLRDEALPGGVAGLVVGGGLPEAYAEDLSANERLREAVGALARSGRPVAAEGAGLVWLCRELDGRPMCGVLDATARTTDLTIVGYREAVAQSASSLLPEGARVVGHKLHRTAVSPRAGAQAAWTWPGGPPEGHVWRGVHASSLTLHWAGTPEIAARFVAAAADTARVDEGATGDVAA
jgi:cobyrinic acid a,c-diamide synthase